MMSKFIVESLAIVYSIIVWVNYHAVAVVRISRSRSIEYIIYDDAGCVFVLIFQTAGQLANIL